MVEQGAINIFGCFCSLCSWEEDEFWSFGTFGYSPYRLGIEVSEQGIPVFLLGLIDGPEVCGTLCVHMFRVFRGVVLLEGSHPCVMNPSEV